MSVKLTLLAIAAGAVLAGCATVPKGPSVAVMPGAGMSFEQFASDDATCRAYADQSLGTDVNTAGANNVITGAAVGTVVGAAAGALLGGHHGGEGGAGAGLVLGTAAGAGNASGVERTAQRRYDIAYEQCMYAKGHQLPSYSSYGRRYGAPPQTVIVVPAQTAPPMGSSYPPPPPPR